MGHDTRAHTRSTMYGYLAREYLQPAGEVPAIESVERRIKDAKTKLQK